jgi:hypothetical protein
MKVRICILIGAALSVAVASAQETRFTVRLSQPLSTTKNHKGDPVAARVASPDDFKRDTIRGTVTESRSGDHPELNLEFDTLVHSGATVPISATVTSLSNSKGQQNVDEDGHAVRARNRKNNANAARQIGSSLGGFLGGRKAAAINTASDIASALSTVQISGDGPSLSPARGAELGVSVSPRGGADPAPLPPNPPSAAEAAPAAPATPPFAAAAPANVPASSATVRSRICAR